MKHNPAMVTLQSVAFSGNISNRNGVQVRERLNTITYSFEFGKSYFLNAPVGEGAWALSWILGGALAPDSGSLLLDGEEISGVNLRNMSCLVRYDIYEAVWHF